MSPKYFLILILISTLSFIQLDCSEPPPTVQPTNPLSLEIIHTNSSVLYLKISLDNGEPNRVINIKRNDSLLTTFHIINKDSIFIDFALIPLKTYTYSVQLNNWSVSAQGTTLDTTSHLIQWQLPDTIGAQGVIRDVWVFSKNDAWAVGEIYYKDSTGKINKEKPFNAAHWNGITWEPKQIPVKEASSIIYAPIYAIYAFNPNDIWFASSGELIQWNGTSFSSKAQFYVGGTFTGQVRKIWGTSKNNIYCVGRSGSIYHYSGSPNWTKMETNVNVDLGDIWGIDDKNIWATGAMVSDGHSVLLERNGDNWRTLYDSNTEPFTTRFYFLTIWTDTLPLLYLEGGHRFHIYNKSNSRMSDNIFSGKTYISYNIRGTKRNDIFNVGQVDVSHFNGNTWFPYSDTRIFNDGSILNSVFPTPDFILIGGSAYTGLNGVPIVIRGYR